MSIDYKELLKKYAQHVLDQGGTAFVYTHKKPSQFTTEEWEVLKEIDLGLKD